ncbi:MAG: bis(5'-nucleosyl)-tetraphosphatase (symmetrical) [Coxiella sp. RIFCSPHIGHO2_12_FULL_44_14]|nr:MAG: bis(5'-nucleosyl)-tetraphosphatase (symmetrical) [Coxiella sp. RIFCSPHIGHO2_12_FULL_44_14]
MSTYIIGDIQGCYAELRELIRKIGYNPDHDRLGFAGDLVNRGPNSLEVLRYIKSLDDPIVVLGNHDLYLLGIGYGVLENRHTHTMQSILDAQDKYELLTWLRQQKLVYHDKTDQFIIVHAGLPPQWSLQEVFTYAKEVEGLLAGSKFQSLMNNMMGNNPLSWYKNLRRWQQVRYTINSFTRLRFCTPDGKLDLWNKGPADTADAGYYPWYMVAHPTIAQNRVFFGHWAALEGEVERQGFDCLDTGCAWGKELTAVCIETGEHISVPARKF